MNFIIKAHFTKNIEPGVSDDQRTEDGADTSSGPGNSHGGSSGSDELGGRVNVSVDLQQWIVSKNIPFPFTMSICNNIINSPGWSGDT